MKIKLWSDGSHCYIQLNGTHVGLFTKNHVDYNKLQGELRLKGVDKETINNIMDATGAFIRGNYHAIERKYPTDIVAVTVDSVEHSDLWSDLNERVRDLYRQFNKVPTDAEYNAIRGMLISKVMLEDQQVYETISKAVYESLRGE